ncbi:MAG TPA: bifunctional alpha,alpha-trehalose-phosphate synthase (UDP-forming)/trehalose-phosphatase, partial [Deltaproteobacteria bacterium]|nr:bifunctional alpha,alpha-trehalose-phosphate synthase (UDP-forming)/trehalose-phosphatase [Deltaproteobacteria bacterium]
MHSLNPSSQAPFVWIGWPGSAIEKNQQKKLSEKMRKELHYLPVFLDEKEIDGYYHGFCNRTIWPLFHCFPTLMDLEESFWESYQKAQKKFCDALLSELRPGDVVWIHDFHLMLLPGMIRAARPDVAVGFFLHVPFPPFEIFQLLPRQWRTRLLEGLLGADLIG